MNEFKWKKIGRIFCSSGNFEWMQSHSAVPIAEFLGDNLFKIYFTTRDSMSRSYIGYVIIDIRRPNIILDISRYPVLSPGLLGTFDDSGAMTTWLTKNETSSYLYYVGWNLGVTVPFRNSIGLAIESKNGEFMRYSDGPILDRSPFEPQFVATCCVLVSGSIWRMWYQSCTEWRLNNDIPQHRYHIKYAESIDGIFWKRDGFVSIDYQSDDEIAICRPSVMNDADKWRMWYCYRGKSYRIGYAESLDGKSWRRLDNSVGISVSKTGWDSEMIEYPYVFDFEGQRFMLYNGNGYGKSGFGLATLE